MVLPEGKAIFVSGKWEMVLELCLFLLNDNYYYLH